MVEFGFWQLYELYEYTVEHKKLAMCTHVFIVVQIGISQDNGSVVYAIHIATMQFPFWHIDIRHVGQVIQYSFQYLTMETFMVDLGIRGEEYKLWEVREDSLTCWLLFMEGALLENKFP